MTDIYESAIALPLGMVAFFGFLYLARHFTYLAFMGVTPDKVVDEDAQDRMRGWMVSILFGAPVLLGFCAASIWLGRYLLNLLF